MALALLDKRQELYKYLRELLEGRGINHKGLNDAGLLALAYNLDYQPLVQNHTLVPYHRAILPARHGYMRSVHGQPIYYSPQPGKQVARKEAWFCPECATEDKASHGLSYWRLLHQLPGIAWCESHERTKLRCVGSATTFGEQPHHVIGRSPRADSDYQASPDEWDVIQRFTEIYLGILKSVYPMPREAALDVIGGNRNNGMPKLRVQLNQLARKRFFSDWLSANFPNVVVKGVAEDAQEAFPLSSTSHFALALALLFDSSDEALAKWMCSQKEFFASKQDKPGASSYLLSCLLKSEK